MEDSHAIDFCGDNLAIVGMTMDEADEWIERTYKDNSLKPELRIVRIDGAIRQVGQGLKTNRANVEVIGWKISKINGWF